MSVMNLTRTFAEWTFQAAISGSVLALIIACLQLTLGRKLTPAWRYALWIPVLLRFAVIPPLFPESRFSFLNAPHWFVNEPVNKRHVSVAVVDVGNPFQTPGRSSDPFQQEHEKAIAARASAQSAIPLTQILPILITFVPALILLRLLAGALWLRNRVRIALSADPSLVALLSRTRAEMKTLWNPRLVETRYVSSPGLFGLLRPKLLLPVGLARQLSAEELRYIFLHELAHLKRWDLWLNGLMSFACAMQWFNPVVWLVARRVRLERELACDALVLETTGTHESRAYGETLIKLLERLNLRPFFAAVVGILEEKRSVQSRLRHIARFDASRRTSRLLGSAFLFALAIVGLTSAPASREIPDGTEGKSPAHAPTAGPDANNLKDGKSTPESPALQTHIAQGPRRPSDPRSAGGYPAADGFEGKRRELQSSYARTVGDLETLRSLSPSERRKVISVIHPDSNLDSLMQDLARSEQQFSGMLLEKAEAHPDVLKLKAVIATINRQIDDRIDGILKGLSLKAAQTRAEIEELEKQQASERGKDSERATRYFEAKGELENARKKQDEIEQRLLVGRRDPNSGSGRSPFQFVIETQVVEAKGAAARSLDALMAFARSNAVSAARPGKVATISGVMSDPQFRAVIEALNSRSDSSAVNTEEPERVGLLTEAQFRALLAEMKARKGLDILAAPKITTLNKRAARVSIDPGPTIELLPSAGEDSLAIHLNAEFNFSMPGKTEIKARANGTLWDGQTLVFWPKQSDEQTQYVVFVTPVLIDAAGNRMHAPGEIPEKFPPQIAE